MKRIVAFDIETIPDPGMLSMLPAITAAGNLKDPEKIAADIKAKKEKQLAEMGLDPMLNMVCCFAWADGKDSGSILLHDEPAGGFYDERALLLEAWEILGKYNHFVTFNGRSFDLRCMLLHGMAHGVRPSVNIDKGKYNRGNHTDMRGILAGDGPFARGKMDDFAKKFLGRGKTDGIDGSQVAFWWEMGLVDEIAQYCQEDAQITMELYTKAEAAGLLE